MPKLNHKVALVTGGAAGLGKAIAQRLASDGARVVITDVQTDLGHATAEECGFLYLQQNVCDEMQWPMVFREVEERRGPLDVLVNNAGIVGPTIVTDLENMRLSDWRNVFAVNVEGVFLGCRAAIPAMRKAGGGSIINISSIAALQATPYAAAYGASKAAVSQLTRSVAQYCARERIRCNSVHPGIVRTALWDEYAEVTARARGRTVEEFNAETMARIPLGDFTLPADVGAIVSFLASDEARHITGAKLIVDGGLVNCDTYRPVNQ
jgi:3(or 17)beta-hydroxysteroid dehydrogenase